MSDTSVKYPANSRKRSSLYLLPIWFQTKRQQEEDSLMPSVFLKATWAFKWLGYVLQGFQASPLKSSRDLRAGNAQPRKCPPKKWSSWLCQSCKGTGWEKFGRFRCFSWMMHLHVHFAYSKDRELKKQRSGQRYFRKRQIFVLGHLLWKTILLSCHMKAVYEVTRLCCLPFPVRFTLKSARGSFLIEK